MVQISPANTSPELTSPLIRAGVEPATYHHRLRFVTYYRDITTDALQGPSLAAYLRQRLHAETYFAVNDPFDYGLGLIGAAQAYAARIGLRIVGSAQVDPAHLAASSDAIADSIVAAHPSCVIYAGDSLTGLPLLGALRRRDFTGAIAGGDALVTPAVSSAESGVLVFATGVGPGTVARSFAHSYRRRFRISVQEYDAGAYDAANITLNAIYMAAVHKKFRGSLFNKRAAVLPYVRYVRWHGVTGVTTFDANGDTSNRIISVYAIRGGKWTFVGKAPKVKGIKPTS